RSCRRGSRHNQERCCELCASEYKQPAGQHLGPEHEPINSKHDATQDSLNYADTTCRALSRSSHCRSKQASANGFTLAVAGIAGLWSAGFRSDCSQKEVGTASSPIPHRPDSKSGRFLACVQSEGPEFRSGRLLLCHAVDGAQTPNEITAMDADNFAPRKD